MSEVPEKNKNGEKVLCSWRVIQGEDGSIRTESYTDPTWRESGPMHQGPWGHRPWRMGSIGPMGRAFRKRRMGRERARDTLDWFEAMYHDFYGGDESSEAQTEA